MDGKKLKFRIWDDENNVYRDVVRIDFYRKDVLTKGIKSFPLDGIEMAYPLSDAMGNSIFPGDIVKDRHSGHVAVVGYDGDSFYLKPEYEPKTLKELTISGRLVVIGNTRHDPDLIPERQ